MAPLPTIEDCTRVDFNWTGYGGVTPHNTIHLLSNLHDMSEIGEAVNDAMQEAGEDMFCVMRTEQLLAQITCTYLGTDNAGVDTAISPNLHGTQSSQLIPNMAGVVSFRTIVRGSKGRGRIYVGPVAESSNESGYMEGSQRTAMLTAWNTFQEELAGHTTPIDLAVASYTHAEAHVVNSIVIPSRMATQRRRLNQLT